MGDRGNNVVEKEPADKKQTYKIKPPQCVGRLKSAVFEIGRAHV